MKTLLMGTTNPAKIAQIRDALAPIGVRVEGVANKELLPYVEEDGMDVLANARKKARAYADAFNTTVLSMDNGLYLDGLAPEEQPGMHVRRIGGKSAATDEELLAHGVELVAALGGRVRGYWEYGICIATPEGHLHEIVVQEHRLFTSTPSPRMVTGYPLESIQIDEESRKYISEMTDEEQALFWQQHLGAKLCAFVEEALKS